MSNQERISLREYGRRIGCSDTAIRKAIRAEKIVKGRVFDKDGKPWIIPSIANAEWAKNYDPSYARETQSGGPPIVAASVVERDPVEEVEDSAPGKQIRQPAVADTSLAAARRAAAVYKAKLLELEMKEKQGKLIDKDQVYKSLFAAGQEVRNALQAIPDRIIDNVLAATSRNEAHKIMFDALADALESLTEIQSRNFVKR